LNIDYHQLNREQKRLYLVEVFLTAKDTHPVYEKLATLLSDSFQIEEKHLDMLHEQVMNVTDSLHTDEIIKKM
jgi:hypothetical protein